MGYEIRSNCFISHFYYEKEHYSFIITSKKNDLNKLCDFLIKTKDIYSIGFNNNAIDGPVSNYLLANQKELSELENIKIISKINEYVDKHENCLKRNVNPPFKSGKIIDLKRFYNWNKETLQWLQSCVNHDLIIDEPGEIKNATDFKLLMNYNENKIKSLNKVINYNSIFKSDYKERLFLSDKTKIDFMSMSEVEIVNTLFRKCPSNFTKKKIDLSNGVVVKGTALRLESFMNVKERFRKSKFGKISFKRTHAGSQFSFGSGGLHSSNDLSIVKSNKDYIIVSIDVESFYPNLCLSNEWHPEGMTFKDFSARINLLMEMRHTRENSGIYKRLLVILTGLLKSKLSNIYDPELNIKITINGQLTLLELYESIYLNARSSKLLAVNTDGMEFIVHKSDMNIFNMIVENWESRHDLKIIKKDLKKIAIKNVSNVVSIDTSENIKAIGQYSLKNLHKLKIISGIAIKKAIIQNLIYDTPIEKTIEDSLSINDFFLYPIGMTLKTKTDKVVHRYYASLSGEEFFTEDKPFESYARFKPINDLTNNDFYDDIDRSYYTKKAQLEVTSFDKIRLNKIKKTLL